MFSFLRPKPRTYDDDRLEEFAGSIETQVAFAKAAEAIKAETNPFRDLSVKKLHAEWQRQQMGLPPSPGIQGKKLLGLMAERRLARLEDARLLYIREFVLKPPPTPNQRRHP